MKCPFCHADNDKVIDSRASEDGAATRRRRQCNACQKRYTTYERVERTTVKVVKKAQTSTVAAAVPPGMIDGPRRAPSS